MYCNRCGSKIDDDSLFCSECGQSIMEEVSLKAPTKATIRGKYRKKRKSRAKTVMTVLAVLIACIGVVAFISFLVSDPEVDSAVETVQNGYLGEFTDLTVKEIFDYSYSLYYEESEWFAWRTDSDKVMVEVKYYNKGSEDNCRTQFVMLNDQCFKLSAFFYPEVDNTVPTEVWNQLTTMYINAHNAKNNNDMRVRERLLECLEEIPCNIAVYGAAIDYTGDRSRICAIEGKEPKDISALELRTMYFFSDLSALYESVGVDNEIEATETLVVTPTESSEELPSELPTELVSSVDAITPFNSAAGNVLASVMMGKNNFTMAETGTHQSLFNMTAFMQFTFENYLMPTSFCVVDMDQDGTNEIIVGIDTDVNGFRLVLHYEYGTVYGYPFGFRGLTTVSTDGLITGSSSAFESSTTRLSFSGLSVEYYNLSYAEEQAALASWQDAEWYDFTEDNVGKFFPNMDISFTLPSAPPPSSTGKQNESFETYIDGYIKYGTEELRIRSGPGTEYEEVGRLREGTQVVILEIANSGNREWGRIDRGWVCMDYIQEGEPPVSNVGASSVYALDYINGTTGNVLNRIGRNYILGTGFSGSKLFYYGNNTNVQFGFVPYDWTNPSISGSEPISVILVSGNARISESLSADMNKAQLDAAAWNTPNVVNVSGQYSEGAMWGSVYMYEIETTSARILYMWYLDDGDNIDYPAGEVTISPK